MLRAIALASVAMIVSQLNTLKQHSIEETPLKYVTINNRIVKSKRTALDYEREPRFVRSFAVKDLCCIVVELVRRTGPLAKRFQSSRM